MMPIQNLKFIEADLVKDLEIVTELFKEYADGIHTDLSFQNFEHELKHLAAQYGKPYGTVLLAKTKEKDIVGCVGIRPLESGICELKRMYLRPAARGLGLGTALLQKAIQMGIQLGYTYMRLDTLPTMHAAMSLYEKEGFYQIEPYRFNPIAGTKYYEKELT